MFRKLLGLALVAVLAGAFSTVTSAAPVAGSFTVDIVMEPQCKNLIAGNQTSCDKIDDLFVKFEADLILTLSVSGLDISSTTVFTFKGVESQAFTIAGTVGALTFKDTFVFAPDLVEIEFVRTTGTLSSRYCINFSTPGDLTPPFLDCPAPDAFLFFLLEDVGVFHPAVANLILGTIFDAAGMLDAPLAFCKKIVDLSINIAGLTIGTRALFANFSCGTTALANWQTGVVLALEGQTVSGITLRSETWIGARQGLECWGECKPAERNYGGKIVSGFSSQEEKLFIRNLVFAGITTNIRIEWKFGQAVASANGLSYVEVNTRYKLQPFGLTISNTLRMNGNLDPRFDFLITSYKYGDMSVTAVFLYYLAATNFWEAQLGEFVTEFDPPGATITSDLELCTERLFMAFCTAGVLEHDIYVSAAVGSLTFDLRLILFGLFSGFSELWVDIGWKVGSVNFKTSLVVATDFVEALAFEISVRF
ncbi:hypothetical protein HY230_07915 [Candidatus Acetothermia bacterium]|nr:hypothetical protein [Candidatus Acetothermia bacterium]